MPLTGGLTLGALLLGKGAVGVKQDHPLIRILGEISN